MNDISSLMKTSLSPATVPTCQNIQDMLANHVFCPPHTYMHVYIYILSSNFLESCGSAWRGQAPPSKSPHGYAIESTFVIRIPSVYERHPVKLDFFHVFVHHFKNSRYPNCERVSCTPVLIIIYWHPGMATRPLVVTQIVQLQYFTHIKNVTIKIPFWLQRRIICYWKIAS